MLLVRIAADADLALRAEPTGRDLRFVAADGMTALPYQREHYDGASGSLIAWVQVEGLTGGVDSVIYLYYGNQGATEQQAGASAWPAEYVGVWHLDEGAGSTTIEDETANVNTAAANNGLLFGDAAVIGTGATFDGTNDFLRVPATTSMSSTTGNATFALWLNWDEIITDHWQRVLASENRFAAGANDGYEWAAQPGGDFFLYPWGGDSYCYNLGPNPFVVGQWHHLVATLDYSVREVKMYVDGVPMAFSMEYDSTNWTMPGNPGDWLWGSNIGLSGAFGGKMDEIQVMRGIRSEAWARTSYANQRTGSTMLTIGPEQVLQP
jgi:hypothetical protein